LISKNFIKTSFIYTLAGALPMASAILLLPFYIQLPTSVYGALSLYLAFSLFVQIVVAYSFDSSTYIHYHEFKNDFSKLSSFISSAFVFMMLIGAGVGLVLVLLGDLLFELIFDDEKISFFPFGLMAVATGIFQALCKVYSNILQSREKPLLFLRSNLLLFTLIATLTVGGLYFFPGTLIGPIGGRMLAGLVVACWALYRIFGEFGFHFNYPLLKSTFGFSHYAFIHQIQQWVINNFDRFLMLFFLPLSSIGVYDFAIKCLIVIEFVSNALHNSFYPKVVSAITAQTSKGTTPELNRYYYGLTAVVMILVSLSIFMLPFLSYFLESKRGYQDAVQYFPYIAVIYMIKSMRFYFAVPFGILKYTKPLPVISFITSAIKIGLIVLLVREFEIYGIIAATLISSVVEIFILRQGLKEKFSFQYNIFKLIIAPAVLVIAVLLLEPFLAKNFRLPLHLFYMAVAGGFLFWAYRNELKLINFSKIFS